MFCFICQLWEDLQLQFAGQKICEICDCVMHSCFRYAICMHVCPCKTTPTSLTGLHAGNSLLDLDCLTFQVNHLSEYAHYKLSQLLDVRQEIYQLFSKGHSIPTINDGYLEDLLAKRLWKTYCISQKIVMKTYCRYLRLEDVRIQHAHFNHSVRDSVGTICYNYKYVFTFSSGFS